MASSDEARMLEEAKALPLSERVSHSSWKVRSEAYVDIKESCDAAFSSEDPMLLSAGPLFPKAVGDANANAMDKALEALNSWLAKANEAQAARIASGVCSTMADKCLKARAGTVSRAQEGYMLFIELEQSDIVSEKLIEAFSNKVPKAVAAALDCLLHAVGDFGPKVFDPKPLMKALPDLFGHSNAAVRTKVKEIVVELASTLGVGVVQSMLVDKMGDAMKKEVQESLPAKTKAPTRYTRKQQAAMASVTHDDNDVEMVDAEDEGASHEGDGVLEEEGDPYDYADPVDILPMLEKSTIEVGDECLAFWDCFESKKWNVRKSAIDKIKDAGSQPRLASGNYGPIVTELRKVLSKDANVTCAAGAAMASGILAKGLRKDFYSYAKQLCPAIMERFKEKNPVMGKSADEALRLFGDYCFSLKDVSDDVASALGHKNPKVRLQALQYLNYLASKEDARSIALCKDSLAATVKLAPDADASIRQEAQNAITTFALKMGGFNTIKPYLNSLDSSRKDLIEKAIKDAAASGVAKPSAKSTVSGLPSKENKPRAVKIAAKAKSDSPQALKPKAPSQPKIGAIKAASKPCNVGPETATSTCSMPSSEEAEELLDIQFGKEVVENLKSPQWQQRLESMEIILEKTKGMIASGEAGKLALSLSVLPGWADKNFQVVNKIFEIFTYVAENGTGFGKSHASCIVAGAVEKIHELKHRAQASNSLTAACERVGPLLVVSQVHKKASAHKNPKVLSESLFWIANTIDAFGYSEVESKGNILKWMSEDLGSANAPVRSQAMLVLGLCHSQVGEGPFASLLDTLKPAQVTLLKEAFAKKPINPSYQPTKSTKKIEMVEEVSINHNEEDENLFEDEFVAEDIIERTDISRFLNEGLVSRLTSSNWKERNAAVEEVENLLKGSTHITDDLPQDFLIALKARFSDTNRNLAARALLLVGMLANAVGPPFDKLAHATLLTTALLNLSDSKKQVRDAAICMLDSWAKTCPVEKLFPALAEAAANPKGSAEGRVASLSWMLKNLDKSSKKCREIASRAVKTASNDKSGAVRDAGAKLGALLDINAASSAPPLATEKSKKATKTPSTVKKQSKTAKSATKTDLKFSLDAEDVEIEACLFTMDINKSTRAKQYRPKPGGFEAPSKESRLQTKNMLLGIVSPTLLQLMFSNDFQDHVAAADMITEALPNFLQEVISSLDLILSWSIMILCEANTQSSVKVLSMLREFLSCLCKEGYRLSEMEASILLPAVIEKSGSNQDYIRSSYREVLRGTTKVFNATRVLDYIVQGLGSKNSRTKVECCDNLSWLVGSEPTECVLSSKQKPVLVLANILSERDPSLKTSALNALESIWASVGPDIFEKMLSKFHGREKEMIEDRIKRSKKAGSHAVQTKDSTEASIDAALTPAGMEERLVEEDIREEMIYRQEYTPPNAFDMTPELDQDPSPGGIQHPPIAARTPAQSFMPKVPSTNEIRTPVPEPLKITPGVEDRKQYPSTPSYDEEALEARWEMNLQTMSSPNLEDAINATKQICSDIMLVTSNKNPPPSDRVCAIFGSTADRFFLVICAQLEAIFAEARRHLQLYPSGPPPSSRGCKFALNALLQGLGVRDLAHSVPQPTLRETICLLLCSLVDETGLLSFEEGPTLVRAVNVLIARMLESVDKNYAFSSLLLLLRSPPRNLDRQLVPKYNDLVVKCLIKLTKSLETGGLHDVDVTDLLLYLHDYFMFLGVEEIRKRSAAEDKPLRMVKTILHQLCKMLGYGVYKYANEIPGRHSQPQPIIFRYIEINLNMLKEINQLPQQQEDEGKSVEHERLEPDTKQHRRTPSNPRPEGSIEDVKQKLKEVLTSVVSRDEEEKRNALRELLMIKQNHPALLEKYLSATQERFRSFIEDSLRHEVITGSTPGSKPLSSQSTHDNDPSRNLESQPESFRKKATSVENLAARMERLRHASSSSSLQR